MIGRSVGLGLAFVLLWAASASAQDFERNGVYLGVQAVYALDNFDVGNWGHANHDNSWGVNARVGYRFHPNVSVELQGEWLKGFDLPESTWIGGDVTNLWTVGVNGKVYLETGRVQPFLMLGMGVLWAERNAVVDLLTTVEKLGLEPGSLTDLDDLVDLLADTLEAGERWDPAGRPGEEDLGFAARFGLGLDVYATEQIVVSLEASYVLPAGTVDDFAYGSFGMGVQYRF